MVQWKGIPHLVTLRLSAERAVLRRPAKVPLHGIQKLDYTIAACALSRLGR
jgi:hypothetical protein